MQIMQILNLVALNINSVQFYEDTKNIELFTKAALFCNLQVSFRILFKTFNPVDASRRGAAV